MKLYDIKKILSLNEVRNCVIVLSKFMGEVFEFIIMNLKWIDDEIEKCKVFDSDISIF